MKALSIAQVRDCERALTGGDPATGYRLMRSAGTLAARVLAASAKNFRRLVFLVGPGNNGGDALTAAAALFGQIPLTTYAVRPLTELTGEAALAASALPEALRRQVRENFSAGELWPGDLVVDGLLGIGADCRQLREPVRSWISEVNASRLPVVSLDVPSGLDADSGQVPDIAVIAQYTLMFGWVKRGLLAAQAAPYTGILRLLPLPELPVETATEYPQIYTQREAAQDCPNEPGNWHKNQKPRVLIISGSTKYPGASGLNVYGALRSGAGLVRLITSGTPMQLPNAAIVRKVPAGADGLPLDLAAAADFLSASQVLVCGSGWGAPFPEGLRKIWDFPGVLLLDADALNTLSAHPDCWRPRRNLVLTPHHQEAVRLSRAFQVECDSDRVAWAKKLAARLGAVVVLKGPRTVVAAPDGEVWLNTSGSVRLAIAGSGDVLSGVLGTCAGREGNSLARRCAFGVWWHGLAGEWLDSGGIADDLPGELSRVWNTLRRSEPLALN